MKTTDRKLRLPEPLRAEIEAAADAMQRWCERLEGSLKKAARRVVEERYRQGGKEDLNQAIGELADVIGAPDGKL